MSNLIDQIRGRASGPMFVDGGIEASGGVSFTEGARKLAERFYLPRNRSGW